MNASITTRKSFAQILKSFTPVAWLLIVAATPALAHWPNTNATKWVQFPDRRGLDVLVAQPGPTAQPIILADDFLCKQQGPITDIHLWTSWLGDQPTWTFPITLSIWSDAAATPTTPSHPGAQLWTQSFAPGKFAARVWSSGQEQFWNPDPWPQGAILGPDFQIWQYNFYPTNPFVQQGTPQVPVVYWLAVTAGTNQVPFGWKTSTNHWNDDAVVGHLGPNGTPLLDWQDLRDPRSLALKSLDLAFALTTGPLITNPPPANKWAQYPDPFFGLDVNATFPNIVADDFLCTAAGIITNVQVWASYFNNNGPDPGASFMLAFWTDVPGGTANTGTNTFSHPGQMICSNWFGPGEYTVTADGTGNEFFYDPDTGQMTPEQQIFRYDFKPKNPCCQKGSTNNPVVYWLSVHAQSSNPGFLFGWKTSTNHWNDDGVFGHVTAAGGPAGDWHDLRDPRTGQSLDLAFVLQNGPPTTDCDIQNNTTVPRPKYVQWPNPTSSGLDVRASIPKILADDFPCRRAGPINAVTVWGSWLNDKVDTNAVFQLGLWTDVPGQPGTGNFSHPGQLLCQQTFFPPTTNAIVPLRYRYRPDITNVNELFYDPNILPPNNPFLGSDTIIWRYDFYPRSTCWRQDGATTFPKVYWLSVNAFTDTNRFLFGWKTSTNHFNDDGVFGHLGAGNLPLGDWQELHDPRPPTNSLDLSFAIRSFPVVGINKDLRNLTGTTATALQIVVAGIHEITWHYDSAWPVFDVSYAGGNTVLKWSGSTLANGVVTHVGFEMGGTAVSIVSMSWFSGPSIIGTPIQVNYHIWNNGTALTLNNDFVPAGVIPASALIEFHTNAVSLDRLVSSSNRSPISVSTLPIQPVPIPPGCPTRVPIPTPPTNATHAVLVVNLSTAQGQPATTDFLQMPLDRALRPEVEPPVFVDSFFDVFIELAPGRMYRMQAAPRITDSFFDVFTEISLEEGGGMHLRPPVGSQQMYYRMVLDPE